MHGLQLRLVRLLCMATAAAYAEEECTRREAVGYGCKPFGGWWMQVRSGKKLITATLASLLPLAASLPVSAQATASGPNSVRVSRFDLFAGYSYLNPSKANIGTTNEAQPIKLGALFSVAGYFNNWLGVQAEGQYRPNGPNDRVYTAQAGPIVRYQIGRLIPFAHALGGGAKLGGPDLQPDTWGYGLTGGVGVDYVLRGFNDRLAIRPIQADYNYNHVDYGPFSPDLRNGGVMMMKAYSLSAGLTLRFGEVSERGWGAALACTANPAAVYAGEPVTVGSSNTGLNPKKQTTYTWTTTGGTITGAGDTIQVATDGLAPGEYTVNGRVAQGGRAYQQATCTTDFTIKRMEPPTLSCSASPTSLHPGESATITAVGNSPSGRPLSYTYSATAGQVIGQASTATLNSGGAAPGEIVITCNVADDKGQTATATTSVQVTAIPVQVAPSSRQLCSINFYRDVRRPARVDNEAKGCLDDIALALQRESDSRLVMVGNGTTSELAAERAFNAKLYLTREKGIDPLRVTIRAGQTGDTSVMSSLVPAGGTFDESMSGAVDENTVVHRGEAYGAGRPRLAGTRKTVTPRHRRR